MQRNLILTILGLCLAATAFRRRRKRSLLSIIITVTTTKPGSGGCREGEVHQGFPRFLCAASLPLSFPGHPVECAGVSGTTHCRRYLSGLREQEEQFRKENAFQKPYSNPQAEIGLFVADAFNRIWKVADAYRKGELTEEQALSGKVLKAILHYGGIEAGRPNDGPRFHASCFAIPTAAVNTYFCYLKQMDDAEGGKGGTLLQEACDMLKTIALQAWTQPLRHDETDENVVSISRSATMCGGWAAMHWPIVPYCPWPPCTVPFL